ncbi:HAD family hydrolase [Kitasatospora sp. NPDC088134]|uniref:HAD family hydrolase n=1 Tax=Kitasatospora sp. NPDC088134 TaxID=3364071 RepID=UPI00381E4B82
MAGESRRAAFFDVDETVITVKSMFDFLRHWHEQAPGGQGPEAYRSALGGLHALAASGAHRSEVNRTYYRGFAGVSAAELRAEGLAWYAAYRTRSDAFVTATVEAMRAHRRAGDTVVLVSGSFFACLEPLAAELGADLALGSVPLVGPDGRLTGEVERPMIGAVKGLAVEETVARLGLDAADCHAYGDHSSDLDMLRRVGHPHQVGADPELTAHALRDGWPRLSADSGPLTQLLRAA